MLPLVTALALLVPPAVPAPAPQPCAPPPAAHRGGTEHALENTLDAFHAAADAGIPTWELDVRFDATGTPVVLHDATVDRISPRTGPITRFTTPVPTDDGQVVPTLRAVYAAAPPGTHVLTELKVTPTPAQWAAVAADIDATVGRPAVTLMSFDRTTVLAARTAIPGTVTALVHNAGHLPPEAVIPLGTSFVKAHGSITAARAATWRAAGLKLYAWTPNGAADWSRLQPWVDAVITDRPIAYAQWAAGRSCPGPTDGAARPGGALYSLRHARRRSGSEAARQGRSGRRAAMAPARRPAHSGHRRLGPRAARRLGGHLARLARGLARSAGARVPRRECLSAHRQWWRERSGGSAGMGRHAGRVAGDPRQGAVPGGRRTADARAGGHLPGDAGEQPM
ncbi:hypothetical protein Sya03_17160 [Spirilliplanes yamanashiensis]|uniref:GP-PDE domain-containing protein n=1 Tax=Spirilliplanes yamanashiensis TaxID=42233 RepID=A0A8J3Y6N5_9ACTN|nr:hypothetical protein Sya03_17160 [Spirilliplanes yamanashiensis]